MERIRPPRDLARPRYVLISTLVLKLGFMSLLLKVKVKSWLPLGLGHQGTPLIIVATSWRLEEGQAPERPQ